MKRIALFFALLCAANLLRAASGSGTAGERPPLSVSARVHLVQSDKEPALNTTLTEEDVRRIFDKVNMIWSQAHIHVELESVCKATAVYDPNARKDIGYGWVIAALPRDNLLKNGLNIFYVKELTDNGFHSGSTGFIVVKDSAKLAEVPGGIDEPIPRVTSHEIGHAFSLQHRQEVINLMASKKSGYALNEAEITQARAAALAKFATAAQENSELNPKPVIPPAPESARTVRPPGSADGR